MSVVPWETGQWIEWRTNTEDRQYNSNISERSAVAYGWYYRLKEGCLLRGWDKLPFALVELHAACVHFVSKEKMNVLMRCNGEWDFDSIFTPAADRAIVNQAIEKGFVEACAEGDGLASEQQYKRFPNRFMQRIHWSITGKCNYRCRHCFMSAPDAHFGELSHDAIMDIAQQIGACGIPQVSLTGGEPLIRPDFLDIVAALTKQGVAINQLYTNGALLSENILDGLAACGQHPAIIMSFDGVGCHDWLRGVDGAERAADAAFALCAKKGFVVQAQMCLHHGNVHALRETINYLASVGCASVRVGHVNDLGAWTQNGRDMTLDYPTYIKALVDYIPAYYADGMPLPVNLSGAFAASPAQPDSFSIVPCHLDADNPSEPIFYCTRPALRLYPDARPALCEELDADSVDSLPIASDDPSQQTTSLQEVLSTGSPYMDLLDVPRSQLLANNDECALPVSASLRRRMPRKGACRLRVYTQKRPRHLRVL